MNSALVIASQGKVFLFVVIGSLLIFPLYLVLGQRQLIYFPRDYNLGYDEQLESLTKFRYQSKGESQSAFLFGEVEGQAPKKVWWIFGGNASLAADFYELIKEIETEGTVFVLFDYPGYGFNRGKPGPKAISQSIDDLQQLLAERWELSQEDLSKRTAVLGHSLGCAAGLDMAARYGIEEIVAVSPFTTMKEMAKRSVGGILSNLLLHRFDNEETLDQIVENSATASIRIFHGQSDEIIPFELGKELAGRHPERVEFQPVAGMGHNDIIFGLRNELREILAAE